VNDLELATSNSVVLKWNEVADGLMPTQGYSVE